MSSNLKLDWCSYEAAKYAVLNWHYSKVMPNAKLARIGVWENDKFIGAILFGRGATAALVQRYGLKMEEGCELVRVAIKSHSTPVSRILSIAMKMLKRAFPKLRLIVSFADTSQGHHGGIYQAGGWLYTGMSTPAKEYVVNGKRYHGRSFRNSPYRKMEGTPAVKIVYGSAKHRYLMALDNAMSEHIEKLRKPYPKRASVV